MSVIPEPPVKKTLYWCDRCNVPLIGRSCACGADGRAVPLLPPYDVRPALAADMALILRLIRERFGKVPVPALLLLNKTGGVDRADLVIAHGRRFAWLTFDPVTRKFRFDLAPEALPFLLGHAEKGVLDLEEQIGRGGAKGRVGGKKFALKDPVPDGTVIVRYRNKYGTGTVTAGSLRVKEVASVVPETRPNPGWEVVLERNRFHLKNLERTAIRTIKRHLTDRPTVNISFSGGKDSTAVLTLARKAGVKDAFFIDTGLEFPETVAFVKSQGVTIVPPVADFWQAVIKAGPPGKDNRWCCKLLKLRPLKLYLAKIGPCLTVQGNRWYESWNRADLDETSQNPDNPLQLNLSPIRNWRALEVFLYLWWQKIATNPLYEKGIERIGCHLCPSMLESEYEELRLLHPDYAARWDAFLASWQEKRGFPEEYSGWGLWRWRALPKKMRELCNAHHIALSDDFSIQPGPKKPVAGMEKSAGRLAERGDETTAGRTKAMMEGMTGSRIEGRMEGVEERAGGTVAEKKAAGTGEGKGSLKGTVGMDEVRKDFPICSDIIYLDSAATSFSPEPVVQAVVDFEHHYRANVGRGIHRLTRIASQRYWHAHEKVAKFVGGTRGTTVFTKNTTEAINMVAQGMPWKPGDRVITTVLEHHSNLLPWMNLASRGVKLSVVGIRDDYSLELEALESALEEPARLVAVTHASNVLGVVTPVEKIAKICHDRGALLLVDAAQSVPHLPVDLKAVGCDFAAFSGHKMCGPTGTGVLWMREPVLDPPMVGGGMVQTVTDTGFVPNEGYEKYEAGTPNIGGAIGLGAAVDYLSTVGMDRIRAHEEALATRLIDGLTPIDRVRVYAPRLPENRIGVISFTVEGIHPHEVAQFLDDNADIMVRSGHHCCQPLMHRLGLPDGTVRASLALYTTREEIDLMVTAVSELVQGR